MTLEGVRVRLEPIETPHEDALWEIAQDPRIWTLMRVRGNESRELFRQWFEAVGNECDAVRMRVGVLDQTSFAKFTASGPGAERFLDRVLANRLPAEVGRMALTQACRPGGGIECDLTVTRLEENFYLVSAAATEEHEDDLDGLGPEDSYNEDRLPTRDNIECLNEEVGDADTVEGGEDDVSDFQAKALSDADLEGMGYSENRKGEILAKP